MLIFTTVARHLILYDVSMLQSEADDDDDDDDVKNSCSKEASNLRLYSSGKRSFSQQLLFFSRVESRKGRKVTGTLDRNPGWNESFA